MNSYKELGNRYLKQNKRRAVITILGCVIVAAVLYAFLNLVFDWIYSERTRAREKADYEIEILSEDINVLESIVNEDFVRSAYFGKACDDSDAVYGNALYITVKNVFWVKQNNKYIRDNYNVTTRLNNQVLWTYGMDDVGLAYLIFALSLFVAYIFAIIGIGIIRNGIQLAALERIKDYGNLRCIGATKKQIRAVVFREAFFQETIGVLGGIIVGFFVSIPLALSEEMLVGFHIIPAIVIFLTFYFDLYFAIGDGVKAVLSVSPVEAVRGSFCIRNRKIRKRTSGIWALIFGVEGDYAYKNIRRNNGRFLKTVIAMSFGLGTVVVIGAFLGIILKCIAMENKDAGYYQHYIEADTLGVLTGDELKSQLYSKEALEIISGASGISNPKYIYKDNIYFAERSFMFDHMNPDLGRSEYTGNGVYDEAYIAELYGGEKWYTERDRFENVMRDYRISGKGLIDYSEFESVYNEDYKNKDMIKSTVRGNVVGIISNTNIKVYGYDVEDFSRYEEYLLDGTTDLSENGVLLINQADLYLNEEAIGLTDEDYIDYMPEKEVFNLTDLRVGDEITIADPTEMDKLISEERAKAEDYDESIRAKRDEWDKEHKNDVDENGVENPYPENPSFIKTFGKYWIIESARQQLVEEGKTKTYVIEGIVSLDPNRGVTEPTIVLPLNNYFEMTGKDENDFVGFQFHISNIFSSDFAKTDFRNALNDNVITVEDFSYSEAERSRYIEKLEGLTDATKEIAVIGALILVIILVSAFNTMNTAISNLNLRRNEFAQLRALGMTKRSLLKAVILEGGIVWIVSSIIGIIGGLIVEYFIHIDLFRYIIATDFYIPWIPIIVAILLEFIVLCGTNIITIRDMKLDIAEELTKSGE